MSPKKVMPLLLTAITPFVMASGTARAAEPQIILAQAQTPQQAEEERKKKHQQQQQGKGQPQQPQPHAQQPQQRNAPGAQPPQQRHAQEPQQPFQQRQTQEQQQKAPEPQQRLPQQRGLDHQQAQPPRQAQEQQPRGLEQQQRPPQPRGLDHQQAQPPKQAQEQQPRGLEQQQAQPRQAQEQQLQPERQRPGIQQQQAHQGQPVLRRELSVEEQKARAEREAHRADRERLIEQQRRTAEAERSQAAINERLRLQNERLRVIASQRREIVDAGGHKYIQEPGNRTIFSVNNQTFIRHDESVNFRLYGGNAKTQRGPNGNMISNIYRPDGSRIEVEVDSYGRPMRRVRYLPDGRRYVLFENRAIAAGIGLAALGAFVVSLPPAHVEIPRSQYIVDASAASEDDIYGALQAPPVEPLDRAYSLDEVLASVSLRERMRSISIDTINFEFGSAEIGAEQAVMLESVAAAIRDAANANPGEVFLIEGHTDAVGSDQDNLSLSDRRAQAVADVLAQQFNVPRENLVTQGYGEQFLLVSTDGPERRNRRVVVRRISPLLQAEQSRYSSGYGAPDTPEGEARQ
jgi:outer membrane protein OmpA-like peptidoglycan-associated protein